jgi:hypothetical protein
MPTRLPLLAVSAVGAAVDARLEAAASRAEVAAVAASRAQAELVAAVGEAIASAHQHPGDFVPDPTSRDAEAFAVRAAGADLAVRLHVSEATIRAWAHEWALLTERVPRTWARFREGHLSAAHARIAAELVAQLPAETWPGFDDATVERESLPPGRFRARLRVVAARLDSATLAERRVRAAVDRRVWVEHTTDGMAWLTALLPAEDAHMAFTAIDRLAAEATAPADEQRTLAQARADVLVDLLTGRAAGAIGPAVSVTVAVTVPVMTLVGMSEEPAVLDGIHPIDAETARRLAVHAPSFTRILTDPISGVALAVDRGTYRVPADLARWVRAVHPTCTFPGCGRRTRDSDLDHTTDYARGGPTAGVNLAPLCRHHHRLKHETLWSVSRPPESGHPLSPHATTQRAWTSPTGHTTIVGALPDLPVDGLP